jgi:3-dehydroquinate synthase
VLEPGEIHKNMAGCALVWQAMLDAKLDRQALALNFGGGVIGDMGGFCAATFKRGIRFIQIPTTLLAMTDAAIGGKLAVDFQGIKNTIGVFQNPAAVLADPQLLQTLPEKELRSGFAEVIKHALIGDSVLWEMIRSMQTLEKSADWHTLLKASIAVKVQIVEADPLEKGLRALLNFGHTIGHALEAYYLESPEALTHGEAVAIGMLTEYWLVYGEDTRLSEMTAVISRYFPWKNIPIDTAPALWKLMQQDKKNAAGAVRMAVPAAETGALRMVALQEPDLERALDFYMRLK